MNSDVKTSFVFHTEEERSFYQWGCRDACNGVPVERVPLGFSHALQFAWRAGWYATDWSLQIDAATEAGMVAERDAICPYTDPELARHWVWGWHYTHGLRAVRKYPALRMVPGMPEAA
jgi:ribosome modulation factor